MIKSTPLLPWLEFYPFQTLANRANLQTPGGAISLRPVVVMLLVLVFVFFNSHLFAQRYEKPAEKTPNPITSAARSVISQPPAVIGAESAFGMNIGDPGSFFSPMIGGLSPASTLLAEMNSMSGDRLWSDGPAVVAVRVQGPLFVGAVMNSRLPSADLSENVIDPALFQPFIHFNMPGNWYVNAITTSTGEMCGVKHVSLPLGPSVGLVHCIGTIPVNMQWGAYYNNTEGPGEVPGWQLRFQIQFPLSY